MKSTTQQAFSPAQSKAAELFKALSHPARLAILDLLSQQKNCLCGNITEELPLAQSTVSQHLKVLKSAGLIKGEIDGVRVCYCLDADGLQALRQLALPFIEELNTNYLNNCC